MKTGLMGEICAWLRVNGIAPDGVPITEMPIIAGQNILVSVITRDAAGKALYDPDAGELQTRVEWYPLLVPPPPAVIPWLLGEVKP